MSGRLQKYQDRCVRIIESKGGKMLSPYVGASIKILIQCQFPSHPPWLVVPTGITSKGSWCPLCGKENIAEEICRLAFIEAFCALFERTRKLKCMQGLELDGYNDELKLAFEYNGRQHYMQIDMFHKNSNIFLAQQKRDRLKAQLCLENGIELVVIPYTVEHMDIRAYIRKLLKRTWYILPKETTDEEFMSDLCILPREIRHYKEIVDIVEHSDPPKGMVLSKRYITNSIHMEFKCNVEEHPPFNATPDMIKSGSWCRKCGKESAGKKIRATDDSIQKRLDVCGWTYLGDAGWSQTPGKKRKRLIKIRRCDNVDHRIYTFLLDNLTHCIKQGAQCEDCADLKETEDIQRRLDTCGWKLISKEWRTDPSSGKRQRKVQLRKCSNENHRVYGMCKAQFNVYLKFHTPCTDCEKEKL